MLRSMFSGVSGLRSHQQMVDVTGNNIANVNTTGFRSSRVQFSDVLSQTARTGAAGNADQGGTNPSQIGLGVRVASVDTINTPGSLQVTGRAGDLALQGEGYFVLRNGAEQLFTRAGAFNFDNAGRLVAPNGALVQGWLADVNGEVNPNGPIGDITAAAGMAAPPVASTSVTVGGNLPAQAVVGDAFTTSIDIFDSLGSPHRVSVTMTKTADNTWEQTATAPDGSALTPATVTLAFDQATGELTSATPAPTYTYNAPGADPVTFTLGYGTAGAAGAITQFGGEATMAAVEQDGAPNGFLRSVGIADGGMVVGSFSNGTTKVIGQVAVASVTNPGGMEKVGDNAYRFTAAAGNMAIGAAGAAGRGEIVAGALEASNVDLAQEFTNLIVAQRGFQANSRVISTSDEILNDLVQLKR